MQKSPILIASGFMYDHVLTLKMNLNIEGTEGELLAVAERNSSILL